MAKKRDEMADGMIAEDADGWLANLLADEEPYDRKMLWQLGSWAGAALGALAFAFLAAQSAHVMRSDVAAANELVRQNQQIALAASERESDTRRLVSAIDTLNADRDRLYSRVSGLEQNLDSVTSSIKQQTRTLIAPAPLPTAPPIGSAPETIAPQSPTPPASSLPAIPSTPQADTDQKDPAKDKESAKAARPASKADKDATPSKSAPVTTAKSETAKPEIAKPEPTKADAAKPEPSKPEAAKSTEVEKPVGADKVAEAAKPAEPQSTAAVADVAPAPPPSPIVTAAIPPLENKSEAVPEIPAAKTEFGVDLGTASSIEGLRALWRATQTSNAKLMGPLRPVIAIKERSGLGMQLRLVAGPLTDAAAAARICAVLSESDRPCETAFFDGQRLTPSTEFPAAKPAPPPRRKSSRSSRRATTFVAQQRPSRNGFSSFLGSN